MLLCSKSWCHKVASIALKIIVCPQCSGSLNCGKKRSQSCLSWPRVLGHLMRTVNYLVYVHNGKYTQNVPIWGFPSLLLLWGKNHYANLVTMATKVPTDLSSKTQLFYLQDIIFKRKGSGFKSCLHYVLAIWSRARWLTCACLSFLFPKLELAVRLPTLQRYYEYKMS